MDSIGVRLLFGALALNAMMGYVAADEKVKGYFNEPNVTCDSLGFQPTFTYNTEV